MEMDTPRSGDLTGVTPEEFSQGFGENIHQTLDVDTWHTGEDAAFLF